ncbi:Transposon Tf2-9 polyprotein [Labeo rohita]|uniref:Transposon Tf2-9 polyprotein n=1 Tax=Labeo rohita TaxID=84645 RepID=A0ABQ8MJR2_LABRO|nr:Transposon Tf2-9 polyprotein [Labeo rohita]
MDSAEGTSLRGAVEFQGTLLGRQSEELAQAHQTIDARQEEDIKDEIYARIPPEHLDDIIELAIRLNARMELRRKVRGNNSWSRVDLSSSSSSRAIEVCSPEPMQIGRIGSRTTIPAVVLHNDSVIDLGAEGNFMDSTWAHQHGLPLFDLTHLMDMELMTVTHITGPEEEVDLSRVPDIYHDLHVVFSRSRAVSVPPHRSYDCAIDLFPGSSPSRGRLFSLSAPEREALEKYLSESLAAGLIRPSSSPAGAGFFFVKKKDGSLRPCIDYRGLNDITIKDREGDEWKMDFNTPTGHFEYLVLPIGLANAPAVFQELINDVHVQHVRRVLQRLLENQLFVKAEKCTFHAQSVSFLGSIISAEGIHMDPAKVVAPLTALTSTKTELCWSNAAQAAFDDLRFRFTTARILILPDPNRQFVVEVDASENGIMTSATESCWQYAWLWTGFQTLPNSRVIQVKGGHPVGVLGGHWQQSTSVFVAILPTVVDHFSKAVHFISLPKLPSAREMARVVIDHGFRIHGLPEDVVSDRGLQFVWPN